MLANYQEKQHLLCTLEPALVKSGLTRESANWILKNIKVVSDETLSLVDYLSQNQIATQSEVLNLAKVVRIGEELESFVEMYQVRKDWLKQMQYIFSSIERMPAQPKLTLAAMENLLHTISLTKYAASIQKNQEKLLEEHLGQWCEILGQAGDAAEV